MSEIRRIYPFVVPRRVRPFLSGDFLKSCAEQPHEILEFEKVLDVIERLDPSSHDALYDLVCEIMFDGDLSDRPVADRLALDFLKEKLGYQQGDSVKNQLIDNIIQSCLTVCNNKYLLDLNRMPKTEAELRNRIPVNGYGRDRREDFTVFDENGFNQEARDYLQSEMGAKLYADLSEIHGSAVADDYIRARLSLNRAEQLSLDEIIAKHKKPEGTNLRVVSLVPEGGE